MEEKQGETKTRIVRWHKTMTLAFITSEKVPLGPRKPKFLNLVWGGQSFHFRVQSSASRPSFFQESVNRRSATKFQTSKPCKGCEALLNVFPSPCGSRRQGEFVDWIHSWWCAANKAYLFSQCNPAFYLKGMAFNPISIYTPPRPEGGLNPIPSSIGG